MSGAAARLIGLAALLAGVLNAAEPYSFPADRSQRSVAITFDDLPAAKSSFRPDLLNSPKAFLRLNKKMLRQLRRMGVPATGFVSSSFQPPAWNKEEVHTLLEAWDKAGAGLGNHTASHWDYHEREQQAYLADILGGQRFLESALGAPPAGRKYFRAPYLHRGATKAARERLAEYLDEHSYTIAPVTIDLQDWMFAEVYAWADANQDWERKSAVVKAYLKYLDAGIAHYTQLAAAILGRHAPHVALLHANALNYDHIEEVMRRFERQGFEFISLETALLDPVYQPMPSASGSWVRGWQEKEGLPWVDAPEPTHYLGSLYADFKARPLEKSGATLQ